MTTLHALLTAQAQRDAGAIALLAPGRAPLRYGALLDLVGSTVDALRAMGIGRGDRVALVLPGGAEMAAAFLGVSAAATSVLVNPAYRTGELAFLLTDFRVRLVIVQAGMESPARAAAEALGIPVVELVPSLDGAAGLFTLSAREGDEAPLASARAGWSSSGDVALVLHTSGTTSRPKIVPLTQANLVAAARSIAGALQLSPADRCLNVMPLFHIHGLSTVLSSLVVGASVVCPRAFESDELLAWIASFDPTWYSAAPTLHHAIFEVVQQQPDVVVRHPFRFVRSASSAMPPQALAAIERLFDAPFIEAYGMTEAAPQIATNPLPPGKRKLGSVGKPAGPEVAILDDRGLRLATGETGEVAIRGANVMSGYENDPVADQAAFVDGWLRTGDQGYLDADGYLFITGRIKEIINRGGEKISPREIDEALLDHPAVAEAVTFAVPHFRLGEDVAAAVVVRAGSVVTPRELQSFLADRLADFKVPRQIVIADAIPRGSSAKQQRLGLAEKFGLGDAFAADATPFEAPRTPAEEVIAATWAQVLGWNRIGIHDNFFRLGGESILVVRVINKLPAAMKATLSVQGFFLTPTVAELARSHEAGARAAKGEGVATIEPRPTGAEAPLSFVQEGLWFLDQLDPHNAAFNVYRAARLSGPVDATLLEAAIDGIARRHDILRTTFPAVEGRPRRLIHELLPEGDVTLPLARIDLRALSPAERDAESQRLVVEEARRPFDLGHGPLMRTTLVLLGNEEHLLLVTAHHVVIDLWSTGVFFQELATIYVALAAGGPSPLPPLPIQHADFAYWQRRQGELFNRQLTYWKTQLADLPPELHLPTDRPRAAARSFRGARRFFHLSKATTSAVKALMRKEGVTLFMTLLAAFKLLLARYTGQTDIVVGSPIANRNRAEVEGLIGILSNTLVLRTSLAGNPTYRKALARVREVALGAYAHQDLPFEQLVEGVQPASNRARMPLFQVNFRVQNDPVPTQALPGVSLSFLQVGNQMAKFDLAIELNDAADAIGGFVEYRTDLFDAATIDTVLTDFEALLGAAVTKPDTALDAFEISFQPRRLPPPVTGGGTKARSLRDVRRKAIELSPEGDEPRPPPPLAGGEKGSDEKG